MIRSLRLFGLILGLGIGGLGLVPALADAQAPEVARPPGVPLGGVDEIRRISVSWDRRNGPERQVVDQVVLVPDVATFLEAIASWDERHFFPILIDDVELTIKFLRAFRPARVVRYPRRVAPRRRRSSGTKPSPPSGGRGPATGGGGRPPAGRRGPSPTRADTAGSGPVVARQPDARRRGRSGRGPVPAAAPLGGAQAVRRHPDGRRGRRAGPPVRNPDRRPVPELRQARRRLRLRHAGRRLALPLPCPEGRLGLRLRPGARPPIEREAQGDEGGRPGLR